LIRCFYSVNRYGSNRKSWSSYCELFSSDTPDDACPPSEYSEYHAQIATFCKWFTAVLESNFDEWQASSLFSASVLQLSALQQVLDGNADVLQKYVIGDFRRLIGVIDMYESSAIPFTPWDPKGTCGTADTCSGFKLNMRGTFQNPKFMEWMNLTTLNQIEEVSLNYAQVNGHIDKMEVVIDWSKYFTKCAPATCVYSSTHQISNYQWAGIVLGIAGGLQTMMKLAVDFSYSILNWLSTKLICKSCDELSKSAFGSLLNCIDYLLKGVVCYWNSACGCCYRIKDNQVVFPSSEMVVTKPKAIQIEHREVDPST
jgi:hypothetical protein